ncbi:subtilisin family serine protease [Anoxybacillus vitaminiphilus]|uniref:Subtilisin family serine protease n=1 Tax=Paranoxybacillus vitaminiphilus TaxID=581036 RepID=A0A327YFU0_9BACL|nr:S8 family serine peptidase [Anoxybacillus vitaminiphilus]RAK19900.1 subtilisin family serine protease [Anoxybacillus vitaminiphilus]
MKKQKLVIGLFVMILSLFFHQQKVNGEFLQEWIVYFDNKENYMQFIEKYKNRIEDYMDEELVLKAAFSSQEIEQVQHLSIVSKVEPNHKKSFASYLSFNDPLLFEQWGLEKIDVYQAMNQFISKNLLYGKRFIVNHAAVMYEEQPLRSSNFQVLLEETKLSRISVQLDHIEGPWLLEVLDEYGNVIAMNTGDLPKLDVLISKDKTYSRLQISLKNTEQWDQQPIVEKVIGVNHVLVAVIDTGVSLHKDFCGNVLHSLGKDYIDEQGIAIDENGHGTHVTGIIAACPNNGEGVAGTAGFAPVDILPLKVLDQSGNGSDFDIAQAVNDAIVAHVDIINLSLAGQGETTILYEAIYAALRQNIIVVAAAGNWKMSTANIYPASYPGVITVAATNQSDNILPYSNYGWEVDISAPGLNIISTYLNDSYHSLSGTSMAAPFVTSAVAFLKAAHPDLDLIQIRQRLFQSALDVKSKGYDIYSGYGIVQISKAVNRTSSESIDWLTMKDFQTINLSNQQILGLSSGLIGKNVYIFIEGQLVSRFIGANSWQYIHLPAIQSARNEKNVTVIAAEQNGNVLASDDRIIILGNENQIQSFADVSETYWAYKDIQRAYNQYLINGFSDGTFRPNEYLKRRHGLMMIHRLFAWPPQQLVPPFKDTPLELSGALAIYSAYEQQVIKGYDNGNFYPEKLLTRAQMAVILARALKLSETSYDGAPYPFKDLSEPKHFAYYAVQQLADKGIITKQDYFRPNDFITRAQFAAMVMRTYDYLQNK